MSDDTTDTTSTDDQFLTDSSAIADRRVGTGKTTRLTEVMAAINTHEEMNPEWFDPKADPDTQNLDASNINPLDSEPIADSERGDTE